ncbi:MAG: sulfatase-like hydrolase/transferase [Bacteroidales bacterium]|nr:sulfatase-like hydrolase/transferase [Candidatus Physcousia equi]
MKAILLTTLLAAPPACSVLTAKPKDVKPARPNIIWIMADDLGYGDISCYGAKRIQTPNIDRVARQGIRFTDMHACASTSTPSRYGILTGEYPFCHPGTDVAAGNAASIIWPQQFTLADAMKRAGYRTAALGKWHLGLGSRTGEQDWNKRLDVSLDSLGFDYSYIMAATADRVPCVFIEQGVIANYDPSAPVEVSYRKNFEGEPTGASHPELLTKLRPSHGHDMSIVNGISRIGFMKGGGKALWRDEDIADSITSHALQFMHQTDEPFFMYLCTNDIHVPRMPHERFRGKSPMGLRGEAILSLDETVGAVTKELERLGQLKNTLIIITSDNGPVLDDGYDDQAEELAGEHRPGGPFRGGKYSAFEAGSVVPFIVSWPAQVKPGVSKALVSQVDAVRTLAAIAGADIPEGAAPHSMDMHQTWLGKSKEARPYAVKMAANHTLVLRTTEWKYIEPSNGGPMINFGPKIESGYLSKPQLYRFDAHPYEQDNQAEAYPDIVKQMQETIDALKK